MALQEDNIQKTFMRKLFLIAVICTPLGVLFLMYLHFSATGKLPSIIEKSEHYALSILIINICGVITFGIDWLLDKKISWRETFLSRFLSGLIINLIVVVPLALFLTINLMGAFKTDGSKIAILVIVSLFIYEILYGWFYSYRYYAHTQVERLRLERWQLELQFESLKSQISPHFLFNCLNTISSLLFKDPSLAEEFIRRMTDTFQYVMSNHKQKFVSLREEIEFVKAYYYLLRVRFENNLKLEINIPESLMNSPLPPLTLQLLVENAIKHNHITQDQPLHVYLTTLDNTHLIVTNTKTAEVVNKSGFQVGLENIRKRYAFFTPEPVIVKNEDQFSVHLPILKTNLGLTAA
jgi:two-component system LytT family sensor kinase